MKKFELILKGVLLYGTALSVLLFMCGIDSLVDTGNVSSWAALNGFLLMLCYSIIEEDDINHLTF